METKWSKPVSPRNTSPLAFQPPKNRLLRLSKTFALAQRPEPMDLLASEDISPTCEHCTDLRRLADVLEQKIKQRDLALERLTQTKAELLGIAVHDLRLPVATIRTYGQLLFEGIGRTASPEVIEWINSIQSVSEFALRLLDDVTDLAMVESGAVQLHVRPEILASIAEVSVTMSSPLAASKQMHVTLVQYGEPQLVLVDSVKMTKVFNNLIENAIKYCQPGARIDVRVWRIDDRVMVSVEDDGPGIEPADLKTLFTPFQRTRARALSEEHGAGLGLAIAKHMVHLHGGQISVRSEIGVGTTFYVSLPTLVQPSAEKS
jgi:signal transduction histidine kinase